MTLRTLADMTAPEVAALDRDTTCVVLTVSPIEQHGPHLPLATDLIEAEGVAARLCRKLQAGMPEWTFLRYPALPLGADCFVHPGTAEVRPGTLQAVVEDLGLSFARQGFRHLMLASHHGGPRHNLALDTAARVIQRRSSMRVLSQAGRLIVELYFQHGLHAFYRRQGIPPEHWPLLDRDIHAGAWETSEMLALRPDLVQDGWQSLPPVTIPFDQLRPDLTRTERGRLGYVGAPALAGRELGEAYLDFLAERLLPDARRFLQGGHVAGLSLPWRWLMTALTSVSEARAALSR